MRKMTTFPGLVRSPAVGTKSHGACVDVLSQAGSCAERPGPGSLARGCVCAGHSGGMLRWGPHLQGAYSGSAGDSEAGSHGSIFAPRNILLRDAWGCGPGGGGTHLI